jgi:predicted P-loop ATPase
MMADVIDLQAWKGNLGVSKQGYKKSMTNLMMFMKNVRELGNTIRWNELAERAEWHGRPIEDGHLVDVRLILESHGFEPTVGDVLPAIMRHAKENSFHPVRDYLRGLTWDGTTRLNHWMQTCLGAPNTPFVQAVGRKTLIAAVARAFKPGCKVDTVLVLEGPQGIKKSTAIATMFSPALTAESVNLFDQHNKMVMSMMGAWCVELAEFIAIAKRDQNGVKGLLSMRVDRVVLPYAKMVSEHPRQCIFFGTINPGEGGYLTDGTGNRRYWPVEVTKATRRSFLTSLGG